MQQPPDPVQGIVAELSKRLDSIETNQRENIQALQRDIARIETNQRDDNAQLRQDMRQDNAEIHRRLDRLTRWIIGIQLTTLIALSTLILTRLPG